MGQSAKAHTQGPGIRGRPFGKGNPGRKPGSKNRASVIAAGLMEGDASAMERKGIEIALAGDVPMLKFFLGRWLPRERLIKLDLPRMNSAEDAPAALGAILAAISQGIITPGEGADLAAVVNLQSRAMVPQPSVDSINLPKLTSAHDAMAALGVIAEAAARRVIDGEYAHAMTATVATWLEAYKVIDLDERLRLVEDKVRI